MAYATLEEAVYPELLGKANPESILSLVSLAHSDDADAYTTILFEAANLCVTSESFCNPTGELITRVSVDLATAGDVIDALVAAEMCAVFELSIKLRLSTT